MYSWDSWFNKASKKFLKPALLIIFMIFGDNISHVPFSIWRLPWLLRFYKTKFDPSWRCQKKKSHANKKISFHAKFPYQQKKKKNSFCAKNHIQKILIPKSHGQKNSHTKNHIVHTCPKNPHDQSHNRKFSLSKITITKISMITQQKYSIAQNLIPIKFFRTHKIFPYSYLQNFAMLMK